MRIPRLLYRSIKNLSERRDRDRIRVRFDQGASSTTHLYFLTPDFDKPSGGIRVIYRHVDLLNACGVKAYVLHRKPGFRCSWFQNKTPIAYLSLVCLGALDLLVVSEVDADVLAHIPAGTRHLIFNQNGYLTWKRASADFLGSYPARPNLERILTVSEQNREMVEFAFPGVDITRVHLGIDTQLFANHTRQRSRRITYMPRRSADDANQVLEMLSGRKILSGWEILSIDGLSHEGVARELQESRIFLAFTHQEGFGLPAAEAMSCGNYVIGNHGQGGKEFFRPEFSQIVETGDTLAFARAVEAAICADEADGDWCGRRGRAASIYIQANYSEHVEAREVESFYRALVDCRARGIVTSNSFATVDHTSSKTEAQVL